MIKFIKEIQTKDRATKMRWLVLFSSISGVIVLGIGMIQFNATFSSMRTSNDALVELDEESGIWSSFSAGISDTVSQIKNTSSEAYKDIKEKLETTNEINIEAEDAEVEE